MSGAKTSPWFVTRAGAGPAPARIYCFPHAGGSPRAFLDWQDGIEAEIVAICRPGREHRAAEPAPTIEEYIEGAATAIAEAARIDPRPSYLVGHSLGALIAFEVCKRLAGTDAAPQHLLASGCSAPCLLPSERVRSIAKLSGREFAEAIGFFGGLSAEVIADDEMRELLLPGIIADFQMAVGYRYAQQPEPLDLRATVVVGRDDPHVALAQVEPWDREFATPADRYWVEGGHFYFDTDPSRITGVLTGMVTADQHVELI